MISLLITCGDDFLDPIFLSLMSGSVGAVAAKVFDGPLKSLDDIWYSSIGYRTDRLRKIAELKNKDAINEYQKQIVVESSKIPKEQVTSPELSIAGPALEASAYYVNNETLRTMFAKLIASSMDKRKEGVVRNSFVEFVKQMNPEDAQVLSKISKNQEMKIDICRIHKNLAENRGFFVMQSEVPLKSFEDEFDSSVNLPSSIVNLNRLGLLTYNYSEVTVNLDPETAFSDTKEYLTCKEELHIEHTNMQATYDSLKTVSNVPPELMTNVKKVLFSTLSIKGGTARVTSLGKDFISVCL